MMESITKRRMINRVGAGQRYWMTRSIVGCALLFLLASSNCTPSSPAAAAETECPQLEPISGDPDGLIFLGLSLSRNFLELVSQPSEFVPSSNNASVSHQTQFDFNQIQDRNYNYFCATNDDGWLVGGGEGNGSFPDSKPSYKLTNPDSAHIEIVHIGNGDPSRGGLTEEEIVAIVEDIEFEPIRLKPSYVRLNDDNPPEFELRFEPQDNPELYALYETLLARITNPTRELGDPFHMTISRKVVFRSPERGEAWLKYCNAVVEEWRSAYSDGIVLTPDPAELDRGTITREELENPGGIYLFWNRNEIHRYFPPTRSP